MMKTLFLICLFLIGLESSYGQITNSNTAPEKVKKQKKEKKEKESEKSDTTLTDKSQFYLTGAYIHSYRKFEDLSAYQSLGERYLETPINTYGLGFGTYIPLTPHLELDLGLSYVLQGEQYNFSDSLTDSTFNYVNKYTHIGVPLRLKLNFGKGNLKGFVIGGLIPSSIISIQYDSKFTTKTGSETVNDIKKTTNDLASFNLVGSIGAGISYNIGDFGFIVTPEYRYNFFNTYSGVPVTHNLWSWGVNFGFLVKI